MSRERFLIGEVAKRSGTSRKALRLYEAAGLLPVPGRTAAGYRVYAETDLHRLEFIREAKTLGLTLVAIRELLGAHVSGNGSTRARVLDMLDRRISQTTTQIAALTRLRRELKRRRAALVRRPPRRGERGYCTCLHKSE